MNETIELLYDKEIIFTELLKFKVLASVIIRSQKDNINTGILKINNKAFDIVSIYIFLK